MSCCARARKRTVVATRRHTLLQITTSTVCISRDLNLCAICAGTSHDPVGGEVDPDLKTVYSSVLPICNICKSHGAKIVVGRYGKNGRTIEESLDKKRRAEAAKAAKAAE